MVILATTANVMTKKKCPRRNGTQFVLSGVHAQPLVVIERSGFLKAICAQNVFDDIDPSLIRAREINRFCSRK